MHKIYQKENNDCVRASIASILNIELVEVPELKPDFSQTTNIISFLESRGFEFKGHVYNKKYFDMLHYDKASCFEKEKYIKANKFIFNKYTKENTLKENNIEGFLLATVFSPDNINLAKGEILHHMVICDTDLNIVHDPSMLYKNIVKYPYSNIIGHNGICYVDLFKKVNSNG